MIVDALALLISKAAFIGLRLLVLYLIAATLGSAQFGALAFALTIAELARFAADWGVDTLSLRLFSTPDRAEASGKFRTALRIRLFASVIGFTLSLAGVLLFTGLRSPIAAVLIAITTVTSLWLNLAVNWLQARALLRPAAVWLSATGAVAVGLQVVLHLGGWGYQASLAGLVSIELVMAGLLFKLAHATILSRSESVPPDRIGDWLKASTPIAIATVLALAYARFDQIFIRANFSLSILGEFLLAARLVEPVLFVAASMTSTIYARASGLVLADGGGTALRTMARKWIGAAALLAVFLAVAIGAAGYFAVRWLFPGYSLTPMFLLIALAALPFRCVNLCMTAFIQALGQFRRLMVVYLINFINVAVLVAVGGMTFGFVGAACAAIIGEAVNMVIQARMLARLLAGEAGVLPARF